MILHFWTLLFYLILKYPKVATTMYFTIQYSTIHMTITYCIGSTYILPIHWTNVIGRCEFASTCICYLTRFPKVYFCIASKEGFLSISFLNSLSMAIDIWVQINSQCCGVYKYPFPILITWFEYYNFMQLQLSTVWICENVSIHLVWIILYLYVFISDWPYVA